MFAIAARTKSEKHDCRYPINTEIALYIHAGK